MVNLQEAGRGRTVQPPFAGLLLYWADIALIVVELLILFAIYLHAKSSHREYLWRKVLAVVKTLTATMSFLGRGISYVRNLWSSPEPRGSDPTATPSTEPAEVPPPGDSYAYYPVEQGSQDADSATSLSAAPNASSPHNRRQHQNNFSPTDTRLPTGSNNDRFQGNQRMSDYVADRPHGVRSVHPSLGDDIYCTPLTNSYEHGAPSMSMPTNHDHYRQSMPMSMPMSTNHNHYRQSMPTSNYYANSTPPMHMSTNHDHHRQSMPMSNYYAISTPSMSMDNNYGKSTQLPSHRTDRYPNSDHVTFYSQPYREQCSGEFPVPPNTTDRYTEGGRPTYRPDSHPCDRPPWSAQTRPFDPEYMRPSFHPYADQAGYQLPDQQYSPDRMHTGFVENPDQLAFQRHGHSDIRRRKQKEPMKYNGRTDFDDYLGHFAAIAHWNNWDYGDKGMQLACSLIEGAREILTTIPSHLSYDYDSLLNALKRTYSPPGRETQYAVEFMNRTCRPNESVAEYGHVLQRLASRAYPGTTIAEPVMMDMYLKGLPDLAIRRHVHSMKPKSLSEAITTAVAYQAFDRCQVTPPPRKPQAIRHVTTVSETAVPPSEQSRVHREPPVSMQPVPTSRFNDNGSVQRQVRQRRDLSTVECFKCHQMGHYARECPSSTSFRNQPTQRLPAMTASTPARPLNV